MARTPRVVFFVGKQTTKAHNQEVDVLSRMQVQEIVAAISWVETNFLERLACSVGQMNTKKLVTGVKEGIVWRCWLEAILLYVEEGRLY